MRKIMIALPLLALSACQTTSGSAPQPSANMNACNASKYQHLVGGPASATRALKIPDNSRHYGGAERIDPNIVPSRLNFVVSTKSVMESITNPKAKIVRVFCG